MTKSTHIFKRLISVVLCTFMIFSVLMSADIPVNATQMYYGDCDYEIDGMCFYLNSKKDGMELRAIKPELLPEELVIPSTVDGLPLTFIYGSLFECTDTYTVNVKSVVIPEGITRIVQETFKNCKSLQRVTLPSTLTQIEKDAFYGCEGLTEISIPDSVTEIGAYAFQDCTSLASIYLPPDLEGIPEFCFKNCTSLSSVDIPASVESIGQSAFFGCTNLVNANIPIDSKLQIFSYRAFYGCEKLEYLYIPESFYSFNSEAFANCTSLKEVKFADDCSKFWCISSNTFENCVSLKVFDLTRCTNLQRIEQCAFMGCSSLESITIPVLVHTISNKTFMDCHSLKTINFAKEGKLRYIEYDAFKNCYSLKSVYFPETLNFIGEGAFENCYNLSYIKLGVHVTSIGDYAFVNCAMTSVQIPNSIDKLGYYCFGFLADEKYVYWIPDFVIYGDFDSVAENYANVLELEFGLKGPEVRSVTNTASGIHIKYYPLTKVQGKYRIYRKTEGSSWKKLADIPDTGNYIDKTAKAGVKYTYTVKFIGSPMNSTYDREGLTITRLTTPSVSKITNTNDGAQLNIKPVTGATKYRVYVRSGSSWKSLGTTKTTTFLHKDVKSGTTYKYTVKAYDASGESVSTYNSSGFTNKFVAPPQIVSVSNAEKGVKITWGEVKGAENYRVFVKSGTKWKKLKDTTSTSYTHTTAKSGETYVYTVRCISSTGKSYKSGYDTQGNTMFFLATPVVKSISNTADGAKITYTAVAGAGKYNIYAKSGSSWNKIGESETTTFVHENAKSGTTYSYRVRAYDDMLEYSSYYKTSSKNTFIAAPVIENLENTSKGVKITWGEVKGAQKYRVFVKSGSSWKKLKDTTSTSYTHTKAEDGKSYTYTVRCISSTGKSYKSGYDKIGESIVFEK